jgi:hypothetical protein
MRQKATISLPQFVASAPELLPPLAAFYHRQLPEFAAIRRVLSNLTFSYSLP